MTVGEYLREIEL